MDDGSLRVVQVPAPFRHLVSLVGRAFYGGPCPPPPRTDDGGPGGGAGGRPASADGAGASSKRGTPGVSPSGKLSTARRFDTRGLGIVLLDALARREWVREEDLAAALRISAGLARKALRYLESERLIRREHRKEGKRHGAVPGTTGGPDGQGGVGDDAAATAAAEGEEDDGGGAAAAAAPPAAAAAPGGEEEAPIKPLVHSYAALDYPGLLDVVRLRRAKLKAVLEERAKGAAAVMEYLCPTCGATYTTLQASTLFDPFTGEFRCEGEHCGPGAPPLVPATGEDDAKGTGAAAAARDLATRAAAQLKPLDDALASVAAAVRSGDLAVPDFGPLGSWAAEAAAAAAERAGLGGPGGPGGRGRRPEEEVRIEIATAAAERAAAERAAAAAAAAGAVKELPPWLRAAAAADAGGPPPASTAPLEQQVAYAAAFEAAVAKRQAELAAAAGGGGDAGPREAKRVKVEGGAAAAAAAAVAVAPPAAAGVVKAEPGVEVKPEPGAAVKAEPGAAAGVEEEVEEEDWEDL